MSDLISRQAATEDNYYERRGIMNYNAKEASEAQEKYCKEHNAPHFAPNGYVGYRCYRCNQNIFAATGHPAAEHLLGGGVRLDVGREVRGISVEEASQRLITGCPFCCASYCE